MPKVTDNTFITIQAFMVNDLQLKGNELLIYSIIYGFSMDGSSWFQGSIKYLEAWSGASRSTVIRTLDSLCEKGLIKKHSREKKGVIMNAYKAIPQNETGGVKMTRGGVKMTPNNIKDNIDINNPSITDKNEINNTSIVKKREKAQFKPPTPEEVQAYCDERNNGITGAEFCDWYASKGWKVGKVKMADWKAAVRTWERARKKEQVNPTVKVGEFTLKGFYGTFTFPDTPKYRNIKHSLAVCLATLQAERKLTDTELAELEYQEDKLIRETREALARLDNEPLF